MSAAMTKPPSKIPLLAALVLSHGIITNARERVAPVARAGLLDGDEKAFWATTLQQMTDSFPPVSAPSVAPVAPPFGAPVALTSAPVAPVAPPTEIPVATSFPTSTSTTFAPTSTSTTLAPTSTGTTFAPFAPVAPPIGTPPPVAAPTVPSVNVTIGMDRVYFTVLTDPLENSTVFSDTTLFVPIWDGDIEDAPNDVICFVGESFDLEGNVTSFAWGGADCTATNGCGVHVHEGFDCKDSETQGGHWYNSDALTVDPWLLVGYLSTDDDGYAQYASCVRTGFDLASEPDLLLGRPFVVHSNDGSRVSCGLIDAAPIDFIPVTLQTETAPISGTVDSVNGYVEVMEEVQANVFEAVCYQGYASGLEPNVQSFLLNTGSSQCDVANGCGAHIHSGFSCMDDDTQGGHFYDPDRVAVDPWLLESYYSTDSDGTGAFVGCAISGIDSYFGKPFIVHGTDGARQSCGILV